MGKLLQFKRVKPLKPSEPLEPLSEQEVAACDIAKALRDNFTEKELEQIRVTLEKDHDGQ